MVSSICGSINMDLSNGFCRRCSGRGGTMKMPPKVCRYFSYAEAISFGDALYCILTKSMKYHCVFSSCLEYIFNILTTHTLRCLWSDGCVNEFDYFHNALRCQNTTVQPHKCSELLSINNTRKKPFSKHKLIGVHSA